MNPATANHPELILIVDDAPESLEISSAYLAPPYQVITAASPLQALEQLQHDPLPDLILLDVAMPDMDGFALLRHLRSDPRTAEIPVIFLTALGDKTDEALGLGLGAADYVHKPIIPAILRLRVGHQLALRQARRALIDANQRLEHRVEERTRDLRLAWDAAQAGLLAKESFLANVSQEIRTPMNGIYGMSNLLLDECTDATMRSYAEAIKQSADELMAVLIDILDYAADTRLLLNRGHFSLTEVVVGVDEACRRLIEAKGLRYQCHIAEGVPDRLYSDPKRLREILLKLLDNACKFTDQGSVTLRIEGRGSDTRHLWLCFIVEDTGCGIPLDYMSKLFQPFAPGDQALNRPHHGLGLGLALARQRAALLGGRIRVDSTPGRGTRVLVDLPFPLSEMGEEE